MREHKKKWLFDKGRTSGSRKRWSYGGDFANERSTKQFKELEDAPKKSGMKTGKVFNNRLSFKPLRRFLNSRVGKDWDVIYSEIKDRMPADIWDYHKPAELYVSIKVDIMPDGKIIYKQGWGVSRVTISEDGVTSKYGRYSHYYVHPETNLLCKLKPSPSPGRKGMPKLTKKEGKKKYAQYKTNRNKSNADFRKRKIAINEEADIVLKEKKKANKNDIQEG